MDGEPATPYKQRVVEHLRNGIFSGRLQAGARVDQDAIAAQLGISRLPVREALLVLEREGLVRTIAHRGTFIAELSAEDIADHYELYARVVESGASRAVVALDEEQREELRALVRRAEVSGGAALQEALFHFYRTLQRAGTSQWRRHDLRRLGRTLPAWLNGATADARLDPPTRAHLQACLDAVEASDGARLGALLAEGIRNNGSRMIEHLENSGFWVEPTTYAEAPPARSANSSISA